MAMGKISDDRTANDFDRLCDYHITLALGAHCDPHGFSPLCRHGNADWLYVDCLGPGARCKPVIFSAGMDGCVDRCLGHHFYSFGDPATTHPKSGPAMGQGWNSGAP